MKEKDEAILANIKANRVRAIWKERGLHGFYAVCYLGTLGTGRREEGDASMALAVSFCYSKEVARYEQRNGGRAR